MRAFEEMIRAEIKWLNRHGVTTEIVETLEYEGRPIYIVASWPILSEKDKSYVARMPGYEFCSYRSPEDAKQVIKQAIDEHGFGPDTRV